MIFTLTQKGKFYASVEYNSKAKTLKQTDGTVQATKDKFPDKLKEEFSVYDPRDGLSHSKPEDKMLAYLCLSQAIFNTAADEVEFDGELWDGTVPDDKPGIVY